MTSQSNDLKKKDQYQVYSKKFEDNIPYEDKIKNHMALLKKSRKDKKDE